MAGILGLSALDLFRPLSSGRIIVFGRTLASRLHHGLPGITDERTGGEHRLCVSPADLLDYVVWSYTGC